MDTGIVTMIKAVRKLPFTFLLYLDNVYVPLPEEHCNVFVCESPFEEFTILLIVFVINLRQASQANMSKVGVF